MADATKAIREKQMDFLKASKTYRVHKTTFIRFSKIEDQSLSDITSHKLGRKSTLPSQLKDELADYILEMEKSRFGFTRRDIRSLAYQLAEKNNIKHSFPQDNESAGRSVERGSTITCVICMSASGTSVTPMMIFPRKRDNPLLMKGSPPGAIHAKGVAGVAASTRYRKLCATEEEKPPGLRF